MSSKETAKRLKILGMVAIFIFFVLIAQLANLQISKREEFLKLAEGNRIRLIPILAPRGTFYDRNGEALVASRAANTVSIVPMDLKEPERVVKRLSSILGMPIDEIKEKIAEQTFRPFDPIRLKKDVGPEILAKIAEQKNDLPGVIIETIPLREYIYGDSGAHLFGYVGEINKKELDKMEEQGYQPGDIIGKVGLERVYDNYLRGVNGGQQVEVNASGQPITTLGEKEPILGNNLFLTIDGKIQETAEKALDETLQKIPTAKGGGVIAIDPRNGRVIALASRPSFDPNKFSGGISLKDWSALINDPRHPLKNRVTQSAYPPGSIYKIVTAVAALEEGKTNIHDSFYCSGHYKWGFNCWKLTGHGSQSLIDGIANSCNPVFYALSERVGAKRLADYSRRFGLGQATGIDLLGEEEGLLPSPQWKWEKYHQEWYKGETLNMAIGQGYHLYTPLQLAQMLSAVVNGGNVYKPYLVHKIISPEGKTVKIFQPQLKDHVNISPESLSIVRQGLREVVQRGTAASAFAGFPIPVGGKTGTAQAGVGKNDHAWFASFAPVDNPQLVVVVFVDQGGHGGSASAPIARKVYEAFFHIQPKAEPPAKTEVTIGNTGD